MYAYAYGQLLALAVYGRYEEEGPSFADDYIQLLSAGGSRSPEELGAIVGVDLADPGFWDKGLDLVERKLDAAEEGRARSRPASVAQHGADDRPGHARQLAERDRLVDGVGELDARSCRPSRRGCRGR